MISIVIPAHNEERVIRRCLTPLLDGLDEGNLEIIVVCNGCTDDTVNIARSLHPGICVLETAIASKVTALNIGDTAARGFPRIYLDADIVTDLASVRAVASALEHGECLVAAPRIRVDLSGRNFWVLSYYQLWLELYYNREGMVGCGFYAIGEEGRSRFAEFPALTADDEFIRRLFHADERKTVEEGTFLMTPPKTVAGIVKIFIRAIFGKLELETAVRYDLQEDSRNYKRFLKKLLVSPGLWIPLFVYAAIRLYVNAEARKRLRSNRAWGWDRDETSRGV